MDIGFETIGNATLICYDRGPILATDPWLSGSAYFGSWTLGYEIPEQQTAAIRGCPYVWISHGHPDHLDMGSLKRFQNKKILLPDHVNGRICGSLKALGFDVSVLKDRVWTRLSDRVRVACVSDYNQDAILLVDLDGCLVVNLNDATDKGWGRFVRQATRGSRVSFLMCLTGFGDADMINFFDEGGARILPPAAARRPVGQRVSVLTQRYRARFFVPFSSMHAYQRTDSLWANEYTTSLEDYAVGFEGRGSEILPAFIRYDCARDSIEQTRPRKTPLAPRAPAEFRDNWSETLKEEEVRQIEGYFKAIFHLTTFLDFINVRVGGQDHRVEFRKKGFERGITFEAPRHSLMASVRHEIFDDMLIGNFMKTTLHGKWRRASLYPDFTPYVAKYADNGRARSKAELAAYFAEYRRRAPWDAIRHRLEETGKDILRATLPADSGLYQAIRAAYHRRIQSFS